MHSRCQFHKDKTIVSRRLSVLIMFKKIRLISAILLLMYRKTAYCQGMGFTKDYCEVWCGNDPEDAHQHTVCKRNNECGPINGCNMIVSTPEFRKQMVRLHNEYRAKVASGEFSGPYGNKGAKNMYAVSYDLELEYIASCWANMCEGLKHDFCKNTDRWVSGQNVYYMRAKGFDEVTKSLEKWFYEIYDMTDVAWIDENLPEEKYPDDKKRGHFTQLVWAESKLIGCARVRYGEKNREVVLICNYGPTGNVYGDPVYLRAADASEIASLCGKDGVNKEFPSLCGRELEPIPTDTQWNNQSGSNFQTRPTLQWIFRFNLLVYNVTILIIIIVC